MTRSLANLQTRITLSCTVRNSMTGTRVATGDISVSLNPLWTSGTGTLQADRAWEYSGSLLTNTSLVVDLYDFGSLDAGAGPGKDILGQSLALSEVVAISIQNTSTPASDTDSTPPGTLEVEPDATAGWSCIGSHLDSNGGSLSPGGALLKIDSDAGLAVTDTSSHRIKLTAKNGSVEYRILVLGRS